MTAVGTAIEGLATAAAFRPRQRFRQLVHDHVPFDDLAGQAKFESVALRAVADDSTAVAVIGPRGGGKSSLIASVCDRLPDSHIALRVPVAGADDPTSTSTIAAVALGQALETIELERYQHEALEAARADGRAVDRDMVRVGGKLGGGPIPAELHGELGTMRKQLDQGNLAVDRLAGLERLIAILQARGLEPIFVFEDTEAAIGGADDDRLANAFFTGPVRAFAREVDAACLIAVQTDYQETAAFKELAPSLALIDLPILDRDRASGALRMIIDNRIAQCEIDASADSLVGSDGLEMLIAFYDETGGSFRLTLAVLDTATDHAADSGARRIEAGHLRAATAEWRDRVG